MRLKPENMSKTASTTPLVRLNTPACLGLANARATTQTVLGVAVTLRKFVLVPLDSHTIFQPVLNSFRLQKDSTYVKAV